MTKRLNAAVLASVIASSVVGWAAESMAAAITLTETNISRKVALRTADSNPMWISKADCVADDVLSFPLYLADYAGMQLEVWGGSEDCTSVAARADKTATCWRVLEPISPSGTSVTVEVRVRDIVGRHLPPQTGPGSGTEADCTPPAGSGDAPIAVSLYFMFINPGSGENSGGYKWATKFDLVGPDAPTELMAQVAGSKAKLTWAQSLSTDVSGYSLFRESLIGDDCTQGTFEEGTPAPAEKLLSTVKGNTTVTQTINLLADGPESIMAVAFDSVGNQSTQLNPVCVEMGAGVDPGSGESSGCSASARTPVSSAWRLGLLGAALAGTVVRRRRH